jgi:hypothetical protein
MKEIVTPCRVAVVGLTILLAGGCASQDATGSRTAEEAARELATLSVELGGLDSALNDAADWAWEASVDIVTLELGREPTEDERARGREVLREVIGEFVTVDLWEEIVAGVFASNFTAAELNDAVRFYSSPAGRKILSLEAEVTDEVDDRMGAALDDEMEAFIQRVDEALSAELGLDGGQGS